jgi:hypothetical protein
MSYIHQNPRPCHAILARAIPKRHDWQSDFLGEVFLEDGRRYRVGVTVRYDRDGEQVLSIYLRPLHLYKTPIATGLEVE